MEKSASTGHIFTKFDIRSIFRTPVAIIQVSLKTDKNKGVLCVKTYVHVWSYLAHLFLELEIFQKNSVERIKHFWCSVTFFLNCVFREKMWKIFIEPGSTQMTIRHMRIACWLPKTTNKRTQVVSYSLLFHSNNDCMTAPQCYAIRTLGVLLQSIFILYFIVM